MAAVPFNKCRREKHGPKSGSSEITIWFAGSLAEGRDTHQRPGRDCTGAQGQHALLDHLVCPEQDGLRDREAKGLGALEVDDQLELGWLLDWKIEGFFTL